MRKDAEARIQGFRYGRGNPQLDKTWNASHQGIAVTLVCLQRFRCTTRDRRAHNTCCAAAYQLMCNRTTAVVRLYILYVPETKPISLEDFYYISQRLLLYISKTSKASVIFQIYFC
ncbi:MAG TPA: hypothetical protein DDW28_04720 [Prevotella sp.]|nr:hypothetical protein [Candidatus Segatella violae]